MKRTIASFSILAFLFLTGCGIKPPEVDPPQGHKNDHFPRTYPDPATDPQ